MTHTQHGHSPTGRTQVAQPNLQHFPMPGCTPAQRQRLRDMACRLAGRPTFAEHLASLSQDSSALDFSKLEARVLAAGHKMP
jgi:hypothetical protein